MKRSVAVSFFFVCSFSLFVGCSKNPVISPPPPAPLKLYVNDDNNGLIAYAPPFTSASTPAFTLAGTALDGSGLAVDKAGTVYAAHFNEATIDVFKQPITSASTPAFTIQLASSLGPTVPVNNASGMSFDPSGNLWIGGEVGNQVYMLAPPFAGGPVVPQFFNSTSFSGPVIPLFDRAGNLVVVEYAGAKMLVFSPPFNFAGNNVPVATIVLTTSGAGAGISTADQLVVGINSGQIAFYKGPFATGNTAAFNIPAPGTSFGVRNSTFDASGNLWVPYSSGQVGMFSPPYSAASTPAFLISSGLSFPYGIGLAP